MKKKKLPRTKVVILVALVTNNTQVTKLVMHFKKKKNLPGRKVIILVALMTNKTRHTCQRLSDKTKSTLPSFFFSSETHVKFAFFPVPTC